MTEKLLNSSKLRDFIESKNISLDFLSSSLRDTTFHTDDFTYDNLFWRFVYRFDNYFELLQANEKELRLTRAVGDNTISRLKEFLLIHNCKLGIFKEYSLASFNLLSNISTSIEDLTEQEKTISLVLINCHVKNIPNDSDLGKEIRKIFNTIKQ
jgi:hypothetical protein